MTRATGHLGGDHAGDLTGWVLRLATAAGLGVDAGIHADLASTQPPGGGISQSDVFWAETAVAILAALLVLLTAARLASVVAFVVAASALGAVLLYRYVDLGTLGALPDMYEPFWYASKVAATIAEAVAMTAAAVATARRDRNSSLRIGPGILLPHRASRR